MPSIWVRALSSIQPTTGQPLHCLSVMLDDFKWLQCRRCRPILSLSQFLTQLHLSSKLGHRSLLAPATTRHTVYSHSKIVYRFCTYNASVYSFVVAGADMLFCASKNNISAPTFSTCLISWSCYYLLLLPFLPSYLTSHVFQTRITPLPTPTFTLRYQGLHKFNLRFFALLFTSFALAYDWNLVIAPLVVYTIKVDFNCTLNSEISDKAFTRFSLQCVYLSQVSSALWMINAIWLTEFHSISLFNYGERISILPRGELFLSLNNERMHYTTCIIREIRCDSYLQIQ